MKRLHGLLLLGALAVALPARADEAGRAGFSLGARGAYAWPFGDVVSGVQADDVFDRMIPLWVDATLRLGGGVEIGPYFQYGWGKGKSGAPDFTDMRLGAQLNYRLTPAGGLTPWLGVGVGWEWLNADTPRNDLNAQVTDPDLSGLDFMVQGGADFRLSPNIALGPFVAFTVGRFSSGDAFDVAGRSKAWHEWLQVGAKLTLDL
jgi:opacity protein-like surface antigen